MNATPGKGSWIWHPEWIENPEGTSAGAFVHFHKSVTLRAPLTKPAYIQITADTKYKLYINGTLASAGPVKGDQHLWFYDELDLQPYLQRGQNEIAVRVLRFYYASSYATSFPRLPYGGLLIRSLGDHDQLGFSLQSDGSWETALDTTTRLPVNNAEDDFLHAYEAVDKTKDTDLTWTSAKVLNFPASHGLSAPWNLSPRMIRTPETRPAYFKAIHNISSSIDAEQWKKAIIGPKNEEEDIRIYLPHGSKHHIELECDHHMTSWLTFRFAMPPGGGSRMRITYSECYEDTPEQIPYLRRKGNRGDTTKKLIGPVDEYIFGGRKDCSARELHYYKDKDYEEQFSPFHLRTLRFMAIDIEVDPNCALVFNGIDMVETHYPLEVLARFDVGKDEQATSYHALFDTSVQTLKNCMHDCYEDCPFYEQLQYAMDARSSALFTYCISGDDNLARQAIIQLHNSFSPSIGLTASRAPSHQTQIIPHFSLFWICMVVDHFTYFNDVEFVRQFLPVCNAIFETFARRIDRERGLIRGLDATAKQWDFVDWTDSWRPMGIPPAASRTGFQTYTNSLYAYSLTYSAALLDAVEQQGLARDYRARAASIAEAIERHCFNGQYFTDGLASTTDIGSDLSQTNQVWAILCGAASGTQARKILKDCLTSSDFAPASTAMSFYVLRAMSLVAGNIYGEQFHSFWEPWREQLLLGMTTWLEDTVSQRSDCHAWGSAPLYDFFAEVAGVKPGSPGWETIHFQPRLDLFPKLSAEVPLRTKFGLLVARVQWEEDGDHVSVSFLLQAGSLTKPAVLSLHVILPDQDEKFISVTSGEVMRYCVPKTAPIVEDSAPIS
ncbi:Six-hairpin glycosidase [Pyrenochaeta sp. DS3sAY3a]|nr:Six-hairpin glycosidase [Pyrenochaeta sp. DS3sAY3a]